VLLANYAGQLERLLTGHSLRTCLRA